MKASLHGSCRWRIALDEESPFVASGEDPAKIKWTRPAEMVPGWTRAFVVAIPEPSVCASNAIVSKPDQVYWAEMPPPETAVEFNVFLSHPDVSPDSGWPGRDSHATAVRFCAELDNGERVWVVEHRVLMPPEGRKQFDDFRDALSRVTAEAPIESVEVEGDLRAILIGDLGDGTRSFMDVALDAEPPRGPDDRK
jgi:hypothetical protein